MDIDLKKVVAGVVFIIVGVGAGFADESDGWLLNLSGSSDYITNQLTIYQQELASIVLDGEPLPETAQGMAAMASSALVSDDIAELAAALEHDAVKIYEFVRNQIGSTSTGAGCGRRTEQ